MAEVLVVDDDPDIRMLVSFALTDAGFEVREAESGDAGLAALEQRAPDLVICDLMMPGLDGFGVLRGMRQRNLAPDARVILLTCKTEEKDHLRGFELGANEYLTKPFDPEELIDCVRDLLRATPEQLAERHATELQKAELLERLESAFSKGNGRGPRGPQTGLVTRF